MSENFINSYTHMQITYKVYNISNAVLSNEKIRPKWIYSNTYMWHTTQHTVLIHTKHTEHWTSAAVKKRVNK